MKKIDILISKDLVNYEQAIEFMKKKVTLVIKDNANELFWFLEHPSIYTCGRSSPVNQKFIKNVPVYNSQRGGKITWHGPGQRIIYFIINMKKRNIDIRSFVFNAEKFIIESLKELNINCYRRENLIGIWTKNKKKEHAKIASLGLRVTRGIIYHGVSINVNCELNNFYNIIPCGILNSKVTSVSEMIGKINNYKIDNIFRKNLKIILNN